MATLAYTLQADGELCAQDAGSLDTQILYISPARDASATIAGVHRQQFDWRQMVRAAEPKPGYYDSYKFTGRRFRTRNQHNYIPSEAEAPQPTYRSIGATED